MLIAIVILGLVLHFTRHSGISYTDGLSPTPPTPTQAAAMGRYYDINVPAREPGRSAGPVGCVVAKPLATRQLSGGVSEAFVQMYSAHCPSCLQPNPRFRHQKRYQWRSAFKVRGLSQ